MTGDVSTWYRQDNFKGERLIIELTFDDAREVFSDCRRDQDPVLFLKWQAKERRELASLYKNAKISGVLFLVVLFFLRRFIP